MLGDAHTERPTYLDNIPDIPTCSIVTVCSFESSLLELESWHDVHCGEGGEGVLNTSGSGRCLHFVGRGVVFGHARTPCSHATSVVCATDTAALP